MPDRGMWVSFSGDGERVVLDQGEGGGQIPVSRRERGGWAQSVESWAIRKVAGGSEESWLHRPGWEAAGMSSRGKGEGGGPEEQRSWVLPGAEGEGRLGIW